MGFPGRLRGFGRCCAALLAWLLGLVALPAIGPELPSTDDQVVAPVPAVNDELPAQRLVVLIAHRPQGPPAVLEAAAASSFSQLPAGALRARGLVVVCEIAYVYDGTRVQIRGYVGTSDPVNRWDPSGLEWVFYYSGDLPEELEVTDEQRFGQDVNGRTIFRAWIPEPGQARDPGTHDEFFESSKKEIIESVGFLEPRYVYRTYVTGANDVDPLLTSQGVIRVPFGAYIEYGGRFFVSPPGTNVRNLTISGQIGGRLDISQLEEASVGAYVAIQLDQLSRSADAKSLTFSNAVTGTFGLADSIDIAMAEGMTRWLFETEAGAEFLEGRGLIIGGVTVGVIAAAIVAKRKGVPAKLAQKLNPLFERVQRFLRIGRQRTPRRPDRAAQEASFRIPRNNPPRRGGTSVGAMARDPRPLQTGGRTIRPRTARELNKVTGKDLHRREWGRALEDLKRDYDLPGDHHGRILDNGDYLDEFGELLGNLQDYL